MTKLFAKREQKSGPDSENTRVKTGKSKQHGAAVPLASRFPLFQPRQEALQDDRDRFFHSLLMS